MTLRSRLLAGAALAVVLPAAPVLAQDVDLGLIVLGDSRRGVQTDTAVSKTTLTQEEIEARQASTMAELLDTVPNATLVNGGLPQGSGISIRGLGIWGGIYGTDGKVSVVVDGVTSGQEEIYRNGSLLSMEPELFKEITVQRGPAESFRYSSGAMGGTVEAQTKDASDFLEEGDTFAFRQKLAFESNGNGGLSTSILAFAPDEKFEVLAFAGYRTVGEREDGSGATQDATGFNLPAGSLKANYHFNDASKLTFSAIYNEIPEYDVPYNAFDPAWSDDLVDRYTKDTTVYTAYSYNPLDNDLINLEARLFFKKEEMDISEPGGGTTSTFNISHITETIGLRLENEALFSTGVANHSLNAGVEVKHRERSSAQTAGDYTGVNDYSAPGGTDESVSVYLVDKIEIGNNLTLTPQIRYEKQQLTSENNGATLACFGTYCFEADAIPDGTTYEAEAITGALAARYEFDNGLAVFGTAAYNENLPILDDLRSTSGFQEQSEKGRTFELGASYSGFDVFTSEDSLNAKLTAFQTNIWDGTTYSGVDQVDLKGVELELSYVHPKFYMDFNAARTRGTINETSDYFDFTPADAVQLTIGKKFMDNQLDLAVEGKHAWAQSRTSGDAADDCATCPTDAYTIYSVSAAYTPNSGWAEGVEFRASVENLFDETYRAYLNTRNGTGRNVKFSVAKTF